MSKHVGASKRKHANVKDVARIAVLFLVCTSKWNFHVKINQI